MAASFKFPVLSKVDEKFHYTPAKTSSDDGEDSLSFDGLLEKDTINLLEKRSILRRYASLILAHIFICFIYLVILYLVASSYASSRRLNGPGVVLCTYMRGLKAYADPFSTCTRGNFIRGALLHTRR